MPDLGNLVRSATHVARHERTTARRDSLPCQFPSGPRFLEELRRVARYGRALPVGDPLAAAVRRIENGPAFAQSRRLTRILAALTYQVGEFRRANIAALDSATLAWRYP